MKLSGEAPRMVAFGVFGAQQELCLAHMYDTSSLHEYE